MVELNDYCISQTCGDGGYSGLIKISPEVSDALSRGNAVVALESTVITHGTQIFGCLN